MQGDRVSGARKAATLETGLVVQVPLFVNVGDTRQGRHALQRLPVARLRRVGGRRCRRAERRVSERLGLAYECEQRERERLGSARRAPGSARRVRAAPRCSASTSTTRRSTRSSAKFSEHWSLERMPVIDRALLRLGTYELGWLPEMPTAVVITEAVELAKQYSTKDSGRFVNGLLVAHRGRGTSRRVSRRPARTGRMSGRGTGTEEIVVPDTVEELLGETDTSLDVPWVVIVWNDPINLMDYVIVRVPEAVRLLARQGAPARCCRCTTKARRSSSSGTREKCETDVARLHAHGLWATMQQDD